MLRRILYRRMVTLVTIAGYSGLYGFRRKDTVFSAPARVISYWPADDRIEEIFAPQPLAIQATIVD